MKYWKNSFLQKKKKKKKNTKIIYFCIKTEHILHKHLFYDSIPEDEEL